MAQFLVHWVGAHYWTVVLVGVPLMFFLLQLLAYASVRGWNESRGRYLGPAARRRLFRAGMRFTLRMTLYFWVWTALLHLVRDGGSGR